VKQAKDRVTVVVRSDAQKVKVGLKGNLILNAVAKTPSKSKDEKGRVPLGILPALRFEVVQAIAVRR